MYSIDYPFESMSEAAKWLDAAKPDAHVRSKIERENASGHLFLLTETINGQDLTIDGGLLVI